jgi:hypothetical protein
MAKIEFEMTLKELSFKFRGDSEQGQKLQAGINRAVGELSRLQGAVSGANDQRLIDVPTTPATVIVRKRRKRPTPNPATESNDHAVSEGNGQGDASTQSATRKGKPRALVIELKQEGFFQTPKTQAQVVAELRRKGYTVKSFATILTRLMQDKILNRNQNAEGEWLYENGPANE